ncbi:hypothetical protein CRUP_005980 [Coryphaenoides rupestris]|nr:hypothetical protein CRUP_005980 [Coryphaenoides rupestris]
MTLSSRYEPVSLDEAEDYLDVISTPMDFQTMLGKFSQGTYRHAQDFMEDLKLVFSNGEEYNQDSSPAVGPLVPCCLLSAPSVLQTGRTEEVSREP